MHSPEKIEHIGIAVKNLEEAIPRWEKILGTPCYKKETVASENVETAFFKTGESKIELLQSLDDTGVIAKYVAAKGEGMHHIAFAVQDIKASMQQLSAEGYKILNEIPKEGADNKWVAFMHPKNATGVLVELCEERR